MRFIKLGIISVVLIFGTIMLISFLLPSNVVVTRGIDINAPIDSVYNKISNLNDWSTWIANKDTLPIEVTMDNKTLAMGKMKVALTSATTSQIKTLWSVNEGQPMTGTFHLSMQDDGKKAVVQWEFVQHLKWYPWEKFSAAITDKVLGPFMEESLQNLKTSVEE